jgi:hypothetical protein
MDERSGPPTVSAKISPLFRRAVFFYGAAALYPERRDLSAIAGAAWKGSGQGWKAGNGDRMRDGRLQR